MLINFTTLFNPSIDLKRDHSQGLIIFNRKLLHLIKKINSVANAIANLNRDKSHAFLKNSRETVPRNRGSDMKVNALMGGQ